MPASMQGVWEKDAVRKNDSFETFEEVMQMAVEHDVDFLLLGGDLFHDNKPSRTTVRRAACISLIRLTLLIFHVPHCASLTPLEASGPLSKSCVAETSFSVNAQWAHIDRVCVVSVDQDQVLSC